MTEPFAFDPGSSREKTQRQLAKLFAEAGSEATVAMIEARMILCAALGIDHAALLREPEKPISAAAETIAALAARRLRHEPVSRILGHREFFGLDLAIDASVLDPRADTETLVEAVIEAMAARRNAPLRLLDLGTGSCAILCALLQSFPKAFGIGIDLSEAACRTAKKNIATLGLSWRGHIVCGNWTESLRGSFDIIVSNPPYIAREEIATLDPQVRDFDPHLALDGGKDGYAAYRSIIPQLPKILAPNGVAVFELGIRQAEKVGNLFEAAGLNAIGTKRDLAGIERAIIARASDGVAGHGS